MMTAELVALPLAQRLQAMEALWDSLCREPETSHATPNWHADVLRQRATAMTCGETPTAPWAEAKVRIREKAEALTRTKQ